MMESTETTYVKTGPKHEFDQKSWLDRIKAFLLPQRKSKHKPLHHSKKHNQRKTKLRRKANRERIKRCA